MTTLRNALRMASLLFFGFTAVAAAEPTKVAIGYPPATDFLPAYVAKEQGIFAKNNIDATLVKDSGGEQHSLGSRLGQHPDRHDDHPGCAAGRRWWS